MSSRILASYAYVLGSPRPRHYAGKLPAERRFHLKYRVDPVTGCHIWIAGIVPPNPKRRFPYGNFFWNGRNGYAHRFAYELAHGPIPEGKEIDHLCPNTLCVNDDHLEAVTHLVNVRRGEAGAYNRNKTHCPAGHAYSSENTYRYGRRRICRPCHLSREATYRRQRKAVAA